ncbi:MAG TPA: response regulator transcription factor [bacterium]|nr:response regulator transcription factor [bacterium]HPN42462.1 response regulator transcription factor [bacterium]
MNRNDFAGNRILLVEDEESLAVGLEYNLSEEGYAVMLAADGRKALEIYAAHPCDLVILDIMLPYMDGFQVAAKMRETDPQIPILMLTARTGLADRLKGLEIGADDYITKPFHLDELLLRVKGMLRRKQWYQKTSAANPVFCFGPHSINFQNLQCRAGKNEFTLTQHEAMVLKYFTDHVNTIVTRHELLEHVWQIRSEVETRTVDIFVARLRKYFEADPKNPVFFKSIRSAGYMFCVEPDNQ